ncbi:perlucin-like protein [Mercenaria mercenaria]|uniref:perlucin-like protein n=1 Tax=Mercenaria mercenaria TaxID=6596 RepID=UPI00234EE99C|nr:perlucin-like protein [Mercenaria mercenaria]
MIFISALIFCGFLSCTIAKDSCYNKTDYEFYIVQNLVDDVQKRIKSLKENLNAAVNAQCPNTTCPNTTCPDGWVSYKGSCYLFENGQSRTFQEARIFCLNFGAVLAYVTDETENNFIRGMLERLKPSAWFISLTDQGTEGVWKWVDTNTIEGYTAWSSGQPQGARRENCAAYVDSDSFRWHDAPCSAKYPSICKKKELLKVHKRN